MPPLTGRVVAGRYNLQTPIGRGAMGVVWRAHDRLLDREVAVKEVVISAVISADERRNAYQRTLREARTAARLSHRGVVAIYDVVEEDGRPWIIMELVPSQSLDQVLVVESRLPTARAGRIGQQLLFALSAAHLAGVLHRDVKPSNVLISANRTGEGWDERAVLTDFGIAQFEGDPRLTQTGMVMGSPGFTAPERIRGSDATPASDLWSLGATIFAAVEGRGPYENRGGAITTMSAIINEDAPVAAHAGPLARVIAALLRRDPAARPSASVAARMFAQALPQLPGGTAEPPAMAHPPTIRSTYVPQPAVPAASALVTASDGADGKETPAAGETPAAEVPAAQPTALEEAAQEAASVQEVQEVQEAAEAVSAEAAVEVAAADSATAESGTPESATPESEPAAESVPAAAAPAEAKPGAGAVPPTEIAEVAAEAQESAAAAAPELPPADAPAAEQNPAAGQKTAAAALLAPESDGKEPGSLAAETVIPRKGAARHQSPPAPVPGARVTPPSSAPAQHEPATSKPEKPKPRPKPKSKPKPTFTAAKPVDPTVPTFSANLARPAPPRPATPGNPVPSPASQRPAYGQGSAAQGYPQQVKGSTTPFSPPPFAPAQYAGPSQAPPDLAGQYPPGSGGGSARRGRQGPSRKVLLAVAAVATAAAIAVGTALALSQGGGAGNTGDPSSAGTQQPTTVPSAKDTPTGFRSIDALNNPSTVLPGAGWTRRTVTRADAQSAAAGFSIGVPPGWAETRKGLGTDFDGPGGLLLEVDLTQQTTSDMLAAATQVRNASVSRFPGYRQRSLQAEPVRHTEGAVWKFTWTRKGGRDTADDIFFAQAVSSGVQDYAIYIRSPSSTFGSRALPLFGKMLRTFQTFPAS